MRCIQARYQATTQLNGRNAKLQILNSGVSVGLRIYYSDVGKVLVEGMTTYTTSVMTVSENGGSKVLIRNTPEGNTRGSKDMTMHVMNILDQTGHTSHGWDPDNAVEVGIAKAAFDEAIKKGYRAFHVEEDDKGGPEKKGRPMTQFNPDAEKMILMPQLQGG